ncbi:MAG: hypothetical protein D4R72_06900 [Nitrosopumilales archaeon]|nr:MAG: hypothetical protein D4R72_06900 [Nitrosopumilales archaeon]
MINMRGQMILAIIPSFITQLIAFYRIRKLTKGLVMELIIFLGDVLVQAIIPWPFGVIFVLPLTVGVPVYFVRKWTLEYNRMPPSMFD